MYCTNCHAAVPEGSTFCPHCGTRLSNGPNVQTTQNIGTQAGIATGTNIGEVRSPGTTFNTEQSIEKNQGVAIGNQVNQGPVHIGPLQISGDDSNTGPIVVRSQPTGYPSIFPKTKNQLERSFVIEERVRIDGFVFSAHELFLNERVQVWGSVYARERLTIGAHAQIHGHVIGLGPIQIHSNSKIKGWIFSAGKEPLEIEGNTEAAGIIALGDVILGKVKVKYLQAEGDVKIEPGYEGAWINARNATITEGEIDHVSTTGDLELVRGTHVGTVSVGGKLTVGPSVHIQMMDTLILPELVLPEGITLRLGEQELTANHLFVWTNETLLPYKGNLKRSTDPVVVSALLHQPLLEIIQAARGLA